MSGDLSRLREQRIPPKQRVDWLAVAVFVLAGGLHYQVYFWAVRLIPELQLPWIIPIVAPSLGFALVAAILQSFFHNLEDRDALLWKNWRDQLLFAGPLAVLFGLSFFDADGGQRIRSGMIGPALLSLPVFFAEEFGWRGFLQNQLRSLPRWPRFLLIAVLWQLCHADFVPQSASGFLLRIAYALPMTVCITVLAGDLVDRSKSILAAVALQVWVELLAAMPGWPVYTGFFVALVGGFVLTRQSAAAVIAQSDPIDTIVHRFGKVRVAD